MRTILVAAMLLMAHDASAVDQASASTQAHRDAVAQVRAGMLALESERYDEAEIAFKSAIKLEPDFEGAFYGLGQTYMRKHQYQDALQAYLDCREAFKHNAAAEAMGDVVADQKLRDQIQVLKDTERALQRTSQLSTPQNLQTALDRINSQISTLESRRRGREHDAPPPVPAGLSMALGSAY